MNARQQLDPVLVAPFSKARVNVKSGEDPIIRAWLDADAVFPKNTTRAKIEVESGVLSPIAHAVYLLKDFIRKFDGEGKQD